MIFKLRLALDAESEFLLMQGTAKKNSFVFNSPVTPCLAVFLTEFHHNQNLDVSFRSDLIPFSSENVEYLAAPCRSPQTECKDAASFLQEESTSARNSKSCFNSLTNFSAFAIAFPMQFSGFHVNSGNSGVSQA